MERERENTQHIIVKYLTEVPLKTKKKAKNARQNSTKDKSTADAQSGSRLWRFAVRVDAIAAFVVFLEEKRGSTLPAPKKGHIIYCWRKRWEISNLLGAQTRLFLRHSSRKTKQTKAQSTDRNSISRRPHPSSQLHPLIGHSNQEVDFKGSAAQSGKNGSALVAMPP